MIRHNQTSQIAGKDDHTIPAEVKELLHDIRLIGGGRKRYDSPDDWDVIRNILQHQNLPVDFHQPDWPQIRKALIKEKERVIKEMDEFYWDGYW